MNISNNSRFQSTEEKIEKALFSLLRINKFEDIYVKGICYEAGINRSSFYAHYQDINDLMMKTENKLSKNISKIFKPTEHFDRENFVELFQFLLEHKNFYKAYLQTNESSFIERDSFFGFSKQLKYSSNDNNYCESEFLYHMTFFGGGLKALAKHWIMSGCKETPEQMTNIIYNEYKNNSKYFK